MIGRQFKEDYYFLRSCCSQDYRSLIAEKTSSPRSPRFNKLSLKVKPDYSKRHLSPSPTCTVSHIPKAIDEPASPLKPKVIFSWGKELSGTTKKVGVSTDMQEVRDVEMKQTKIPRLHNHMLIESKFEVEYY